MIGIYLIKNTINNKVYIGQSIDIEKRWTDHIRESEKGNNVLYRAIRKYGIENFSFEIIEECSIEELNEKEMYYIEQYNTYIHAENSNGYNMTLGGESTLGMKHSEETKSKLRILKLGKKSPMKGRITPLEVRQKQSEAKKGEKSVWFGKTHTEETKKKIQQKAINRRHTEETKKKISESRRGKPRPQTSKEVVCEGKIFLSVKECAKAYGINYSTMKSWMNGSRKMRQDFIDKGLCFLEDK